MFALIPFGTEHTQTASRPGHMVGEPVSSFSRADAMGPFNLQKSHTAARNQNALPMRCTRAAIQCSLQHLACIIPKGILQCSFQLTAVVWLGLVTTRWFHSTDDINSWSEHHENILRADLTTRPSTYPPQYCMYTPSLYMHIQTQYVWL